MKCVSCTWIKIAALAGVGLVLACTRQNTITSIEPQHYAVSADSLGQDTLLLNWLLPYQQQLKSALSEVVAYSETTLQKALPESSLGNLLAETVLESGRDHFGRADVAMLNYGGIRAALPKDSIRVGHVMEMLPFVNTLQLVKMRGELLQLFLDHWAAKGGTPIAGVRFAISAGKAVEVYVNGASLDPELEYWVVMPDYVANGGDGCGFLSEATHVSTDLLLFDVVLAGFRKTLVAGRTLNAALDGRIYQK